MLPQFFVILIVTFVNGATTSPGHKSKTYLRIAGGEPADIKNYPYQVSLDISGDLCGGSIISQKFILTAAHCTMSTNPTLITVRAGSNYSDEGGQVIPVLQVYEHPGFDSESFDADVAILELASPLEFDETIQPINLPASTYEMESYLLATVTGFGRISPDGPPSDVLMKVDLPLLTTEDCQYIYGDAITEKMFCAGYDVGGKDACGGDSGGPIVIDQQVIGIVSYGPECGSPGMPGVYTKVTSVLQFIDEVIASENSR